MLVRRLPFLCSYIFSVCVALSCCHPLLAQGPTQAEWAELRRQARERPRALIYDNDGNDSMSMTELTAENFLEQRTAGLANSNVDTIFYCANATFGMSTRPSRVWQERNWKDERANITKGYNVEELKAAGLDSLELVSAFARANGIEAFTSIRMNDIHDHSPKSYGPAFFENNTFKNQHPEWLLGTAKKRSRTAAWSAVNYLAPEVREHMFRYVEEACTNYDLDGISLDFFRHPAFFPSTFSGKPATQAELDAMTGLVQQIHEMVDAKGRARRRPLLLSIRVPDSTEYCRAIGLDVEQWLEAGWIDLVVTSGYFQLNDWKTSAELGRKYDVPVYASLDEPRLKDEDALALRQEEAAYRGRVSAVLDAGLSGVTLFNFRYDDHSPLLSELGDADLLKVQPQMWFAAPRAPARANGGNLPYGDYQSFATLTPDTPKDVTAAKGAVTRVRIPRKSEKSNAQRSLHLQFSRAVSPQALTVTYGGQTLPTGQANGDWLEWDITDISASSGPTDGGATGGSASDGVVEVRVELTGDAVNRLQWKDLYVREVPQ